MKLTTKTTENKLIIGFAIIAIGIICLLRKIEFIEQIPNVENFINIRMGILLVGIILLLTKTEKALGITLTIIGGILNINLLLRSLFAVSDISVYILPFLLIIIGLKIILTNREKLTNK